MKTSIFEGENCAVSEQRVLAALSNADQTERLTHLPALTAVFWRTNCSSSAPCTLSKNPFSSGYSETRKIIPFITKALLLRNWLLVNERAVANRVDGSLTS